MSENNEPQYAADLHRQGEVTTAGRGPNKKRRYIGRIIGFIFVGLVVGAAIIGILKFVNDPVQGTISSENLKASIAPTPTPEGLLNGLNFELKYPGKFNQIAQVKSDVAAIEQYTISSSTSYRRSITVDYKSLPSGHVIDDSSYRLRQIQTEAYSPSTKDVNGETVVVMTKNDGSEESWFWIHGGNLLIVAVTTSEPGEHATDIANQVMSSVKWRS